MTSLQKVLLVSTATVALAVAGALTAAERPNFTGDWALDMARSTFGPYPAPTSFTRQITHNDPMLTIVDDVKGGAGGDQLYTRTYPIGGAKIEYETGGLTIKSGAAWDGDALAFNADGSVPAAAGLTFFLTERYTLTDGGKTLTHLIHVDAPDPVGTFELKYIFNRR